MVNDFAPDKNQLTTCHKGIYNTLGVLNAKNCGPELIGYYKKI